jgi:hypothetical protein
MSRFDSDLFDYEKIARIQNADISNDYYKKTVDLNFINEYENSISYKLEIKRKNLIDDFDRFWLKYILYSLLYAGSNKNIYELIEIMKNKIYDSKTLLVKVNEKYPSLNLENEEQLLKLQF